MKIQLFLSLSHRHASLTPLLLAALLFVVPESLAAAEPPVKIIFDTDFGDDGDDLASLAVLHHLADLGEVEILAIGQSNSRWDAPGAIDVINTWYGRPDIPIGIVNHKTHEGDQYSSFLVKNYKYALDLDNVPDAVSVYRKTLVDAPDHSVKFVVVGFKSNMRDLLMSEPDDISPLSGIDLIKKKVILVSDMGGKYPSQDAKSSFNFRMVEGAAKYYVDHWPTPMIFSGIRTGGIKVGMKVRKTETPVGRAMELKLAHGWKPGETYQAGFDLAAVLIAARGADRYFNMKSGCNHVDANGGNEFDYGQDCGHQHVDSQNRKIDYKKIGEMLEQMMLIAPKHVGDVSLSTPAKDPNIHYEGIKFASQEPDGGLRYKRFTDKIYELSPIRASQGNTVPAKKAQTTPCVKMLFKTDSPTIKLAFKTPLGYEHRGANFGVYQNGTWWKSIDFGSKTREMELVIQSQTPGDSVLYSVAFPSWSNPHFYGMQLEDGHQLEPFAVKPKNVYVAYGDSVSHGTGQKSASYLTWPYQLAEKLDYEIYSLAVGGASIKPHVIEMFDEFKKIDLITIYIGINDSARKSLAEFRQDYDEMLSIIREHHPDTKVFCITIHAIPEDKVGKFSKVKLVDYRKPIVDLIRQRQQQGDKNLFLIDGQSLTTLDDAMNPGNVHLSIDGAANWAQKLYSQIKDKL